MTGWIFRKKTRHSFSVLGTDIHSHLLPGLDDGVATLQEAEAVILILRQLGYRKLITTPHVMSNTYRNTSEQILAAKFELTQHLKARGISVEIEAAGEYYLDETLMERIDTGQELLTFAENLLLFETNFITEPLNLKDFLFKARAKRYRPVMAHPERYLYLHHNQRKVEDLIRRGVMFQVNISSLAGQYSKVAQQMALELVRRGWVAFLGSDCHNLHHARQLGEFLHHKYVQKALSLPLLNSQLK